MADQSTNPESLTSKPVVWLNGRLRNQYQASNCRHLDHAMTPNIAVTRTQARLTDTAEQPVILEEQVVVGQPLLHFSCRSPKMLEYWCGQMAEKLPHVSTAEMKEFRVTLDVCQMCPFYEKRMNGST